MKGEKENALLALLTAIVMVVAVAVAGSTPLAAQDGPTVYKSKCAMCHGADGKGETPIGKKLNVRDLGSPEVQKQTDPELTTIISKGKSKMPSFEGKLTAEQIGQVLAHIRDLGKKK
jgi:cytochrome c6